MRPWLIPVALLLSAAYWAVADDYLRASISEVATEGLYKDESASADWAARTDTLADFGIDDYPELFLSVLEVFTMAQLLFAKVLVVVLLFLGPLFVPWLFFKPTALLLLEWCKALIVFSLYGVLAAVVLSGVRSCLQQC
ncbi:MAG: hypothetical protein F4X19_08505 [Acidobacteria bacterium]|nr:hypothetical protein [Acidobacteriota bacterium]